MKRPKGFVVLSFLLAYLAVAGFVKGLIIDSSSRGYVTESIAVIYGVTALASAIGLWMFRPWAFQATISWSITALLLMLNMEFGMGEIYTMPMIPFLGFALFFILFLVLLLYYVKKKLRNV